MLRRAAFIGVVLSAAFLAAGCCSLEDCKSKHGLLSDADCVQMRPQPVPGPKIVLRADANSNLIWQIEESPGNFVTQTDGGAANGQLRDDFIGVTIDVLKADHAGGTIASVNRLVLEDTNAGRKLQLRRSPLNTAVWKVFTGGGNPVTLTPSGQRDTGTVPSEFLGFNLSHVQIDNQTLTNPQVTYRVNMPN